MDPQLNSPCYLDQKRLDLIGGAQVLEAGVEAVDVDLLLRIRKGVTGRSDKQGREGTGSRIPIAGRSG